MKRIISMLLALVLAIALSVPAYAAGQRYTLTIQANGSDEATVTVGDEITVTLQMTQPEADSFSLYSMQDYVCFDTDYFAYVDDSIQVYSVQIGEQSRSILQASALKFYATGDGDYNRVFINRASSSAEELPAGATLLTFRLKAQKVGTASITHSGVEVFQTVGSLDTVTLDTATVTIQAKSSLSGNNTNVNIGNNNSSTKPVTPTTPAETTPEKVTITDTTTNTSGAVTEVNASISSSVKEGEKVTIPVEVTAAKTTQDAPVVNISVAASSSGGSGDSANKVKVEIPVTNVTPGTVAVLVKEDGTEEIVKTSALTEDGLSLTIDGDTTLKIIDNTKTFTDVAEDYWADDAITFSTARGIFNGTSATTFEPASSMTRGMLAQVIYNLENAPETASKSDFLDVSENSWCADAISWAAENGIVGGYGDGKFGTNDSITREQLATMLWRYAGEPTPTKTTLNFSDAGQASGYAKQALLWANENGILNGMGNGILNPKGLATRAQVAQMMMNFVAAL